MKKAMSIISVTITLIVFVALFIVVFQGTANANTAVDKTSRVKACTISIHSAEVSKYAFGPVYSGIPKTSLKCYRDKLIIGNEIIDKEFLGEPKLNEEAAGKIIGDAIAQGWNAVGEGEKNPLPDRDMGEAGTDLENIAFCIVWDEIIFTDGLIRSLKEINGKEEFKVPMSYLCNTPRIKGSSETYCDYFFETSNYKYLNTYPDIDNFEYTIKDGTRIVYRIYKGNLVETADSYHPDQWSPNSYYNGFWTITLIGPDESFQEKNTFVVDEGSRIVTGDDEEVIITPYCTRLVN